MIRKNQWYFTKCNDLKYDTITLMQLSARITKVAYLTTVYHLIVFHLTNISLLHRYSHIYFTQCQRVPVCGASIMFSVVGGNIVTIFCIRNGRISRKGDLLLLLIGPWVNSDISHSFRTGVHSSCWRKQAVTGREIDTQHINWTIAYPIKFT